MKINELIQWAEMGNVTISKTLYRERVREIPQYKSKDFKDGEDFYTPVSYKKVPYKVFNYLAQIDKETYKITRKDMKLLLEAGAKVGEIYGTSN